MKFGFTSTSFRNIKDVEKVVSVAVKTGADCIEWGGDVHVKDVETAKRVRKLCDDAKISVSAFGSYYRVGNGDEKEWTKTCEIASALGTDLIRVWLGKTDSEKTEDAVYKSLVEEVKYMCEVASGYGLVVCPECHDHTYNNNTDAFLKMRKDVGMENFCTYFQSRYKKKAYDLDRIERTLPYIESVHISYWELAREQFPKYNPSYMDELLDKLKDVGYDGSIVIEFTHPGYQMGFVPCMKRDIRRLKAKMVSKK